MDYIRAYGEFLKKFLKPKRKLRVVWDGSNGTAGRVLLKLFRNRKIKAIFINAKPNGNFPAHGPNPLAPGAARQLEKAVKKYHADLGVIFDADGDRMFLVDDRGRFVGADETGYLLLRELKPKKYAISVISGKLLRSSPFPTPDSHAYRRAGQFCVSRVGHYFFKKLMREKKISLGLEPSGHYYFRFPEFGTVWDSGILAAIRIINFVSGLDRPLSGYLDRLPKYYRSEEINFKYPALNTRYQEILKKAERFYKNQGAKISKLDGLTAEFPNAWLNLRLSHTENLLRLNAESASPEILRKKLKEIRKLISN